MVVAAVNAKHFVSIFKINCLNTKIPICRCCTMKRYAFQYLNFNFFFGLSNFEDLIRARVSSSKVLVSSNVGSTNFERLISAGSNRCLISLGSANSFRAGFTTGRILKIFDLLISRAA